LGYISAAESVCVSSTLLRNAPPKATKFHEITQRRGHYAIQGHPDLPNLVPIESSYATSY